MFPQIPNWTLLVTAATLAFGVIPIAASEGWRRSVCGAASGLAIFVRKRGLFGVAAKTTWVAAPFGTIGVLLWLILSTHQGPQSASGTASPSSYEHLRTRPIYQVDNERDRLIVLECEHRAVKAGRLYSLMHNDEKRATEHFRWCLGDQGLDWDTCEVGEAGCGLLRYLGMRSPAGSFRSLFVD